jgi:uncharacterized protein (DUF1330 family)
MKASPMPAYLIVICKIKDRARFLEAYAKPAAALVARHGGRYLVRAPGALALEGGLGGSGDGASVVISEFPTRAALEAFWFSPDYAALKAARADIADVDVLAVESPAA